MNRRDKKRIKQRVERKNKENEETIRIKMWSERWWKIWTDKGLELVKRRLKKKKDN